MSESALKAKPIKSGLFPEAGGCDRLGSGRISQILFATLAPAVIQKQKMKAV